MFIKVTQDNEVIRLNINTIFRYQESPVLENRTRIYFIDGSTLSDTKESPEEIDELIKQSVNDSPFSFISFHLENLTDIIKYK